MRRRRKTARWQSKLRDSWRLRTVGPQAALAAEGLVVRPLEERRVLSVSPAVAMALAAAGGEVDIADGFVANPDPATPLGTDAAHHEPVSGGPEDASGQPAGHATADDELASPAAEDSERSDNASAAGPESVQTGVEPGVETNVDGEQAPLELIVAGDQGPIDEGANLTITDVGQFTDANNFGDDATEYEFTIDWGDGTSDAGLATIDVPGSEEQPTQGSFDAAHTYADNGVYTVTVTVTSPFEQVASDTFVVIVNNVAPTLTVPEMQFVDEGALLSVTDIGQVIDPGFDNPLNEGGELTERFTFAIDWGDGSALDSGPVTIDGAGEPGVPTSGSFDGSHVYADNGVYTVTVTVSDDDGGTVSESFTVIVNNVAPTLVVPETQVVDEGAVLSITDIGQFTDPGFDNPLNAGGELTERFTFAIDWGDGSELDSGPVAIDTPGGPGVPTAGSFDGSHVYADNGVYTVTVTLSDDDGGTVSETFTVIVNNVAPTLVVPETQVIDEGALLSLTNIGQFTDPGYDNPLNAGGELTEQFTFAIDWGDGTPLDSGPATIDTPGGPGTPTAGSFDGSHVYADNGVYTVTVTVSDDDGGTVSESFSVIVNNVAPTLVVPETQVIDEGALLSITDIGQFTDPGFDNPLNEGGELTEQFTFAIDWGDGTPLDSGPATIDTPGGPGTPTAGSFDGSHVYADNGVYTVTVTVSDDDGGTVSETFTVIVNNVAPTLVVPRDQVIDEGALLSITNIGQFTDPGFDNPLNEGGELTEQFTFAIDWGDGTPLDSGPATIDTPGGPGTPTAGSFDGSHVYADNGVYTVTVTVSDDDGGTVSQSFTVVVNNVAPTLDVPETQVIDEGALLSITDIGQFTDPGFDNPLNEGGELTEQFTFAIDWGDGTPLDSGSATIDTPGGPGTPTAGSFDGSHIYADNGVYTVTVTVSDDDGGTVSQTFTVIVNNVAPTLVVPGDQMIDEGATLSIVDIGQFTDPGFDNPLNVGGELTERFTYAIDWGDGSELDSGPATIDTPGGPGTPTAGSFDGSHVYADNGIYTVTVTISDDDGGTVSETFQVVVDNVAPTLIVAEDQFVDEGSLLQVIDIGQFTDPGFDNPEDGTSETFTYTIDWGDGTPLDAGVATIDTPGAPGVPTAGSFDGSHIYADNGVYTVTVTVMDDDGGVSSDTLLVIVNNVAPTLVVPGDQMVEEGQLLSLIDIGQFTDPGFDNPLNVGGELTEQFTFAIDWGDGTPLDSGPGTIDTPGGPGMDTAGSFNGSHVYTATGLYTVTVTISDDDGGTTSETFQVLVKDVTPILVAAADQRIDEGSLLTVIDIGSFVDPRIGGAESYTYTIDWGDGLPLDAGTATIDSSSEEGPTTGSFDGAHVYADNGIYTVVLTLTASDGRMASTTLNVTVDNVAPTLTVPGPQLVPLGTTLSLTDIGLFTDPGFDNPLNFGGEVAEQFTFSVDWGDGLELDSGPGEIDVPGEAGVLTAGSFDAANVYGSPGTFTATVTVADDDGGSATGQFTVVVFVLKAPPVPIFVPGGAGGGFGPPRAVLPASPVNLVPPADTTGFEFRRVGAAGVAGAEPRLVLRVVSPEGIEATDNDEQLPDEVLDNLRSLFRRLPDGHYRIYRIEADGVEWLVVDVIVSQGRDVDAGDVSADTPTTIKQPAEAPSEPETAPGEIDDQAPANDTNDPAPADDGSISDEAAAQQPEPGGADLRAAAVGGIGYAAHAAPRLRRRLRRSGTRREPPSPTKARRLLRRLRSI